MRIQPAEWAPHQAVWVAWPSHEELWGSAIEKARTEFIAMCRAIRTVVPGRPTPERLCVLVLNEEQHALAQQGLSGLDAEFHVCPFGDIWLRDTAPIFVWDERKNVSAQCFRHNGWGGKYELDGDPEVAGAIARASGKPSFFHAWVLEGGSVEVDGQGTLLTTDQCLLNPNRNPDLTQQDIERHLRDTLGASHVLWLREGLLNDHTDGHIDTIARFCSPGIVVCMEPSGLDDPNRDVLVRIREELIAMRDAQGRKLEVLTIPSPGRVVDSTGRVMPASHVNFYLANGTCVVPVYGTAWDDAAAKALEKAFPGRSVVPVSARAILEGGGAFHCITQQQPIEGFSP